MKQFSRITFLLLPLTLLFSCISKKKYQENLQVIEALNMRHTDSLQTIISGVQKENRQLNSRLSEEAGANRALAGMQSIYMYALDSLQMEIQKLGSNAQSTRQNLDQRLAQKDETIKAKEATIEQVKAIIQSEDAKLEGLLTNLSTTFSTYPSEEIILNIVDDKVRIQLFEAMMFRTGSLRIRTKGHETLETIAAILNQYPSLYFSVLGHTDNKAVRGFKDNWDFAALRAAAVVRVLTEDYEVSPNQITAASKGEFAPQTSNSSSEGRATNRRVEIFIEKRTKDTVKKIQAVVE